MEDKQRLRRAYKILKKLSFYLMLVFLTALILGLISGMKWMFEMSFVSLAASFGVISASDIVYDLSKGSSEKVKETESSKGS